MIMSERLTAVTIGGRAVVHGEAVQVAAVLGGEPRDEGRLPQRLEAVGDAHRREAGEFGVDEDHPAGPVDAELVDVDVAGGLGVARHVEPVEILVGPLVRGEHVLEPPDLEQRADIEPRRGRVDAHRAHVILLVEGDLAARQQADQEQLAGLVGGEGEAAAVARQPVAEAARDADLGLVGGRLRRLRRGLRLLDRDARRGLDACFAVFFLAIRPRS